MWGRQNYTLRFLRLYWGKNALNTFHTVIYSGGGNVLRISPFFFSSTLSLFHWTHLVSPFLHLIGPAPNYNPHCLLQEIHHIIHAMIIINLKLIADLVGYVGRDHIMETFVSSTSCFLLSHHFWRFKFLIRCFLRCLAKTTKESLISPFPTRLLVIFFILLNK